MMEIILTAIISLIISLLGIVVKLSRDVGELKGKVDLILKLLNEGDD